MKQIWRILAWAMFATPFTLPLKILQKIYILMDFSEKLTSIKIYELIKLLTFSSLDAEHFHCKESGVLLIFRRYYALHGKKY